MDTTCTILIIIIVIVLIGMIIFNLWDIHYFTTLTVVTDINNRARTLFWVNIIGGIILLISFIFMAVHCNSIYNKYKTALKKSKECDITTTSETMYVTSPPKTKEMVYPTCPGSNYQSMQSLQPQTLYQSVPSSTTSYELQPMTTYIQSPPQTYEVQQPILRQTTTSPQTYELSQPVLRQTSIPYV